MDIICSGCKKKLGEKPGEGITHGLCLPCVDRLYPWMNETKKEVQNVRNPEQEAV
jgi:hypothetical protein